MVESQPSKLLVAGSIPVSRSIAPHAGAPRAVHQDKLAWLPELSNTGHR
jgi:hypothetical protein